MNTKPILAFVVILSLCSISVYSLEIQEPVEGDYLSGKTLIKVNLTETDFHELEFHWGYLGNWNKLGSMKIDEDSEIYSFKFNASKLPESRGILLRVDGVECSSDLCWTSKSQVKEVAVDKTPPRVINPWLVVEDLGSDAITVVMRARFIDSLSGVEEIHPSASKIEENKYMVDLSDRLNESFGGEEISVSFLDKAGNRGVYELNYELTDRDIEFDSGGLKEQIYLKKDKIINHGNKVLHYEITHASLENGKFIRETTKIDNVAGGESKELNTRWLGSWIDYKKGVWEQNMERTSTPEQIHFKKSLRLNSSEDLPSPLEFTYNASAGDLSACSDLNISEKEISLESNETKELTLHAAADCIETGELEFEEKIINGEEAIIASYKNVTNHFTEDLEIHYSLDEVPPGFECDTSEGECTLVINSSSSESTEANFTLFNETEDELDERGDETTAITGYFAGALGDNLPLQLSLGLITLVGTILVFHKFRKKEYSEEDQHGLG